MNVPANFSRAFQLLSPGCLAILASCATRQLPLENHRAAGKERLSRPGVEESILGALVWLDQNQVRDRPGKGSPAFDATSKGDGARHSMRVSLPFRGSLEVPAPPAFAIENREGEWSSEIHLLPDRRLLRGRGLTPVLDFNLFCTAQILQSCYLVDDRLLPDGERFVSRMRGIAARCLSDYRREKAWNFWPLIAGSDGDLPRSGNPNVSIPLAIASAEAYLKGSDYRAYREALRSRNLTAAETGLPPALVWMMIRLRQRGQDAPPLRQWLEACLGSANNPAGADALFNIPADADEAAAVALLQIAAREAGEGPPPETAAIRHATKFRDVNRDKEYPLGHWKGRSTGAYVTWIADENEPPFAHPREGVIPLGINNVDAVVNANMIHALSRLGLHDSPGYREAIELTVRCIRERAWPEAGLYYPQRMAFPYAASRAWREGRIRDRNLDQAMGVLLRDLLDLQDEHARRNPLRTGAFPGGEDPTEALSTAMGLNALLFLGEKTADRIGELARYRASLDRAARRLVAMGRRHEASGRHGKPVPVSWEAGVYFGTTYWGLAQWTSEAVTTALAMEALSRYALDWDLRHDGARLALQPGESGKLRLRCRDTHTDGNGQE